MKQQTTWLPNSFHQNNNTPLRYQQWLAPEKEIHFFCDLHADADAFLRSLKLSELITDNSSHTNIELTQKASRVQVVIGGDCFDKGPINLKLFRLIHQLYLKQMDLIMLAGNHDIRIYAGLLALDHMDDLRQSHFFVRMGRKTAAFFYEIYQEYCIDPQIEQLPESIIYSKIMPSEDWYQLFPHYAKHFMSHLAIQKEVNQIRKKQTDFLQACAELGMSLNQVYQAALKAKELFVDDHGEFSWFFSQLDLLHTSGSYLYCHAGVDDSIVNQLSESNSELMNRKFRDQLKQGAIFQMYYSEYGNVFRTKYRSKDWSFSLKGGETLKSLGINAIVNGHRSHTTGQQLFVRSGILNFECDTQLNKNCRKKTNMILSGEAVTIFSTDGTVSALSSELETIKRFHPSSISA